MGYVAIVTDGSACLTGGRVEEHRIVVVPQTVIIDGTPFRDGAISSDEFYALLHAGHTVRTASPSPGEFLESFRQARHAGASSIVCLPMSSRYSATYESAVKAAELAATELPGCEIIVAETGGIAATLGFAVTAAARSAEAGATVDEILTRAKEVASRAHLIGALDTTRYLAKGGRIPRPAHWAVALLGIKPVLAFSLGRPRLISRPRTIDGAMNRMLAYAAGRIEPGEDLRASVLHANAPERAAEFCMRIQSQLSPRDLTTAEFTPVMAAHTGPGFLGLAFYSERVAGA